MAKTQSKRHLLFDIFLQLFLCEYERWSRERQQWALRQTQLFLINILLANGEITADDAVVLRYMGQQEFDMYMQNHPPRRRPRVRVYDTIDREEQERIDRIAAELLQDVDIRWSR